MNSRIGPQIPGDFSKTSGIVAITFYLVRQRECHWNQYEEDLGISSKLSDLSRYALARLHRTQ